MRILPLLAVAALPSFAWGTTIGVMDQAEYGGHTYFLVGTVFLTAAPTGVSWFDAENYAINALGGHLATINDLAENQWIFDRFVGDHGHVWLGAFRVDSAFQWVADGENVTSYDGPWYPVEPNGQDKLMMLDATYANARWNDRHGTFEQFEFDGSPIFAIVEFAGPIPEPTAVAGCLPLVGALCLRRRR